ncbi:tryptophan--tRNA ligase, partial [Candidatus Bathyarchaeota archaeon]|nr:tryptophan--tRNA ligase [Candidatus Bathyarchaeota archaeon]
MSSDSNVKGTKLDPFGTSVIENYESLYGKEFGIQPFKPFLPIISNPAPSMRRGVIFGHRDFERVLKAMDEKKEFAVISGIK